MFIFAKNWFPKGLRRVEFIFHICCDFRETAYAHFEHKQYSDLNFEIEYQESHQSVKNFCKCCKSLFYVLECMCTNFGELLWFNRKDQFK